MVEVAADIVMVVDESRSMDTEHLWLRQMVLDLEQQLRQAGIGSGRLRNHYMLVGYGKENPWDAHTFSVGAALAVTSDLVQNLLVQLEADVRGWVEDGYQAMMFAMDQLPIRRSNSRVPLNIILVSDEDRDGANSTLRQSLTTQLVRQRLRQEGATLNVVVDQGFTTTQGPSSDTIGMDSQRTVFLTRRDGSFTRTAIGTGVGEGFGRTFTHYTQLAWDLGGASWDINKLREGGNSAVSFTDAFTNVKTEEVTSQFTICQRCSCSPSLFWNCAPDSIQERCLCNTIGKVSRITAYFY